MSNQVAGMALPPPAYDPIAIAALIAELPELEAKFLAAKKASDEAQKALDVMQDRIDRAIHALKIRAPGGSAWARLPDKEMTATEVNLRMQLSQSGYNPNDFLKAPAAINSVAQSQGKSLNEGWGLD